MYLNKFIILKLIFFVLLLTTTAMLQCHFKMMPQLYMLIYGALTLSTFHLKPPYNTPVLFRLLLIVMTIICTITIGTALVYLINPNDGKVIDVAGVERRVMPTNWIIGVLISIFITPAILYFYHKKLKEIKSLDRIFVFVFLILTSIIFISNEII